MYTKELIIHVYTPGNKETNILQKINKQTNKRLCAQNNGSDSFSAKILIKTLVQFSMRL